MSRRGTVAHVAACNCCVCNHKPPRPLAERFWDYVVKGDGCWAWTGPRLPFGYGSLQRSGSRPIVAHRLSYMMHVGPIPDGLVVMHVCDNPPCTNPNHLRVGTVADNNRDMTEKGRRATKTHCNYGHELTPANRVIEEGARRCRECRRKNRATYYRKRKAAHSKAGPTADWNH